MKFYRENKINPAASCLPIVLQIPIFISLFYVLRDFENDVLPQLRRLRRVARPRRHHRGRRRTAGARCCSSSTWRASCPRRTSCRRRCRGRSGSCSWSCRSLFVPFILNFPAGLMLYWLTTNLWTTGQGLVTRRLMPKPAAAREAQLAHAGEGGASRRPRATAKPPQPAKAAAPPARKPVAGPPRRVKRKSGGGGDEAMSDEITVEATGETVGEAKWSALRELERRVPGLDREAVRFQVVTEGERGLLGVGLHAGLGRRDGRASADVPAAAAEAARRRDGPGSARSRAARADGRRERRRRRRCTIDETGERARRHAASAPISAS